MTNFFVFIQWHAEAVSNLRSGVPLTHGAKMKLIVFLIPFMISVAHSYSLFSTADSIDVGLVVSPSNANVRSTVLKQAGSKGVFYYDVTITNKSDTTVTLKAINLDISCLFNG
jgi:hypothetical protein